MSAWEEEDEETKVLLPVLSSQWHLGFFAKEYTPMYRGFDSHRGYYQGCGDYWDHTYAYNQKTHDKWGLDFWKNKELDKTSFGEYSTEIFTSEAERIIHEHDTDKVGASYTVHWCGVKELKMCRITNQYFVIPSVQ